MPPEGYYERLFEEWSKRNGRSDHKRMTAKEQVKEIEFRRNIKVLAMLMCDYIKQNPN